MPWDGRTFPPIRTRNGRHPGRNRRPDSGRTGRGEAACAASGTRIATQGEQSAWVATGGAAKARVLATTDGGRSWNAYDTPIVQGTPASQAVQGASALMSGRRVPWSRNPGIRNGERPAPASRTRRCSAGRGGPLPFFEYAVPHGADALHHQDRARRIRARISRTMVRCNFGRHGRGRGPCRSARAMVGIAAECFKAGPGGAGIRVTRAHMWFGSSRCHQLRGKGRAVMVPPQRGELQHRGLARLESILPDRRRAYPRPPAIS